MSGVMRGITELFQRCDMIKWKESDVADIVFEILAKKDFEFLCFTFLSVDTFLTTL